ncbi:helix-turn-helix domain-containing protein [Corynebacterium poyangense]|uniref:Helix-turn-helix domain-containing protein n=1 Tax=Corynebacterium poyangense TaxID=2684405 RepID=A0A7H0SKX1_9CORY|nr:transcriptional regulator [Corynebacterium poyangense]MBZ8177286.1 helix-turn-helix domain-containing protein [Corynebacterium poyangense]QNQ89196.1 helix-turn-helix domain-containing protein [Corynebacterium poyangense]
MSHPRNDLDPELTNPLRFSLLASLSSVVEMTFKDLRDYLDTTDSTLSKHASALEKAGYIKVKKGFVGKKPQTKLAISQKGAQAFRRHLTILNVIAQGKYEDGSS